MKEIKVGDLVRIDKDDPAWVHLHDKPQDDPVRQAGIVTEIREDIYIITFGKYRAYLRETDILKVSE